jgi:hypothetical protein
MKITEYDHLTQETIIRDATAEEIAQRKIDATRAEAELAARQAEAEAKAAERQAILDRLGLTAHELQTILG